MQAMILAAGLGTRLKPYTDLRPKPLFTIGGRTLLERHIDALAAAGCESIIINTYHLAHEIHRFIERRSWPVPIHIRQETTLLDSAGAVSNVADRLRESPLLVVNGDTLTDIDPKALFDAHLKHGASATLALIDRPEFNNVSVDDQGRIHGFRGPTPKEMRRLAFTGMQVLSPEAVAVIPKGTPFGMVDLYRDLIQRGEIIHGVTVNPRLWFDCGTEKRYMEASKALMIPQAFSGAFGTPPHTVRTERLKGDGSDRAWSRLSSTQGSLICCEHGIHSGFATSEANAMLLIGRHLQAKGIPTSPILTGDPVSGLIIVQDAGNIHLMDLARSLPEDEVELIYRRIIEILICFSQEGIKEFDTAWCWQTPTYDKEMILTMECHYFMEQFIQGYLGINEEPETYRTAFHHIADQALSGALTGLMHRDFQSRNLMMADGLSTSPFAPLETNHAKPYTPVIIDFQGARRGPLQYDLASLLIDPYTALPEPMQERLLAHATQALNLLGNTAFTTSYTFCAIARNLQILGALGKLTQKGKAGFQEHIPQALITLKNRLKDLGDPTLEPLSRLVEKANKKSLRRIGKPS